MHNITLRSFDWRQDLRCLYAFVREEVFQEHFPSNVKLYTLEQFEKWLSDSFNQEKYRDFFIMESGDYTLGFVYASDFSNEHCHYTMCLYDDYINKGFDAVAGIKMIDYLFKKYPLKQIYISVVDCHKNSLESNLKCGFEEVGKFPDYSFLNGEFHSLHIMRITRKNFYYRNSKRIGQISKGEIL